MNGIKPLVAGNWKMNGLRAALSELQSMVEGHADPLPTGVDLAILVPATLLREAAQITEGSAVGVGGQDCHAAASGAHTGDISAEMIRDAGGSLVIVGHSERRTDHGETDSQVRDKAEAAQRAGLMPIVCIGETEAQRRNGETLNVLERQLDGSLPEKAAAIVAYEPVWAIGTGLTPSVEDVAEAHRFIRERVVARYGSSGSGIRLLYGGSVKPANAGALMAVADVDGALVGGASLKAADLLGIVRACAGQD